MALGKGDEYGEYAGPPIDGILEYDNPLPRWWLWMFYGSIVWAVVYCILYPSWWGVGMLGWSQKGQYEAEMKMAEVKYPKKEVDIASVIGKPESIAKGREIFVKNCVACHGPEGKGLVGPNLTDAEWIHGGEPKQIVNTITNGILEKGMPTWKSILGSERIALVASYVHSLSDDKK